jgi:peptide/nickel transport system substrate-binding protein
LKQIPFDVAGAQALLDSAGWIQVAGQTTRSKDGIPLSFEILVPNTSKPRMTYGQLLVDQFRALGVTVTLRNLETRVLGPAVDSGTFDAYIGSLTVTPGLKGVSTSWGTAGVRGGGFNYGWYSNPRFDATLDSALAEFAPEKSADLWVRAYQIILDDAPAIWLYEERNIGVMHARIRPAGLRADAWYVNLADWSVDPDKRIPRDKEGGGVR